MWPMTKKSVDIYIFIYDLHSFATLYNICREPHRTLTDRQNWLPRQHFLQNNQGRGSDGDENNEMHILAFMTPHSAAKAEKQKEICNLPYPYIVWFLTYLKWLTSCIALHLIFSRYVNRGDSGPTSGFILFPINPVASLFSKVFDITTSLQQQLW